MNQHLLAEYIERACFAEVLAPKPGNVSPRHSFANTICDDFLISAKLIAPILTRKNPSELEQHLSVGRNIYDAVHAVRTTLGKNTNLGIILLLAPLACIQPTQTCQQQIEEILDRVDLSQTELVFKAIQLANPGGLGSSSEQDIHTTPTQTLRPVMKLAEQKDQIARQYAIGYKDIFRWASSMQSADFTLQNWSNSIVELQLRILIEYPDTLIARKCGLDLARDASLWALKINFLGGTFTSEGQAEIQKFHEWLTADGNMRNPGTTADLIAALLFVAQRDYHLKLPETRALLQSSGHNIGS